jgi:UDP-glucose 4-epimerase
MSPYGNTKQIGEEIITDTTKVTTINSILLRYFNPIGAHPSAEIGELPIGVPQNLVPFITQTGLGLRQELSVYGDDYPTPDGTCIRDYIHVVDLAKAHVIALKRLLDKKNLAKVETFNLGTGTGSSVLEVIRAFEKVSGQKLIKSWLAEKEILLQLTPIRIKRTMSWAGKHNQHWNKLWKVPGNGNRRFGRSFSFQSQFSVSKNPKLL